MKRRIFVALLLVFLFAVCVLSKAQKYVLVEPESTIEAVIIEVPKARSKATFETTQDDNTKEETGALKLKQTAWVESASIPIGEVRCFTSGSQITFDIHLELVLDEASKKQFEESYGCVTELAQSNTHVGSFEAMFVRTSDSIYVEIVALQNVFLLHKQSVWRDEFQIHLRFGDGSVATSEITVEVPIVNFHELLEGKICLSIP